MSINTGSSIPGMVTNPQVVKLTISKNWNEERNKALTYLFKKVNLETLHVSSQVCSRWRNLISDKFILKRFIDEVPLPDLAGVGRICPRFNRLTNDGSLWNSSPVNSRESSPSNTPPIQPSFLSDDFVVVEKASFEGKVPLIDFGWGDSMFSSSKPSFSLETLSPAISRRAPSPSFVLPAAVASGASTKESASVEVGPFDYDVPGDGDCLFWCFTLSCLLPLLQDRSLFNMEFTRIFGGDYEGFFQDMFYDTLKEYRGKEIGNQEIHTLVTTLLRNKVMDYAVSQADEFLAFLLDEERVPYVAKMRQPGWWGGDIEISVLSALFQRHIIVYNAAGGGYNACYGKEFEGRCPTIHIVHAPGEMNQFLGSNQRNHYRFQLKEKLEGVRVFKTKQPLQQLMGGSDYSAAFSLVNRRSKERQEASRSRFAALSIDPAARPRAPSPSDVLLDSYYASRPARVLASTPIRDVPRATVIRPVARTVNKTEEDTTRLEDQLIRYFDLDRKIEDSWKTMASGDGVTRGFISEKARILRQIESKFSGLKSKRSCAEALRESFQMITRSGSEMSFPDLFRQYFLPGFLSLEIAERVAKELSSDDLIGEHSLSVVSESEHQLICETYKNKPVDTIQALLKIILERTLCIHEFHSNLEDGLKLIAKTIKKEDVDTLEGDSGVLPALERFVVSFDENYPYSGHLVLAKSLFATLLAGKVEQLVEFKEEIEGMFIPFVAELFQCIDKKIELRKSFLSSFEQRHEIEQELFALGQVGNFVAYLIGCFGEMENADELRRLIKLKIVY